MFKCRARFSFAFDQSHHIVMSKTQIVDSSMLWMIVYDHCICIFYTEVILQTYCCLSMIARLTGVVSPAPCKYLAMCTTPTFS